ncbi:hypothetical protein [Williamsia sp. CHRR-6]|uniref:hypothetical protein n=1 Tax=Williamsia sp. CHRR-6 TaxID=2835871 RepID=UPI001BDAD856|nr:hypothetical protein [Williamsia sp. CHRR-6]MBT0565402.1 hypothetical protein [Williamsia sp. CHRR-6]
MISDDERIAAARAYVDALATKDPSDVRVTPDCRRVENGITTGRDGAHIIRTLRTSPLFAPISGTADFAATVTDGVAHATFTVIALHRLAVPVRESFTFDESGAISSITAKIGRPRLARR